MREYKGKKFVKFTLLGDMLHVSPSYLYVYYLHNIIYIY